MIRRAKGLELKIIVIIHLNTFGSKVFLTLKIMDFENVVLIKNNSYMCTIRKVGCSSLDYLTVKS
jgi:hypothetical protein